MWDEIILGKILSQNQSQKYNIFEKYFSKLAPNIKIILIFPKIYFLTPYQMLL